MINNSIIGEQLSDDYTTSATDVGFDFASYENRESSPNLGKFKSVDELIKAYNNLQSEFTKKCQSYNELLKEQNKVDNVEITPAYEKEDWQCVVDGFLQNHPNAKTFSKEIAEIISSDKDLISNQNSLEIAYGRVLEKENARLNNLVNDEEYIFNKITDKTKEKILKEYLNSVNSNSPFLMNSKGGNNVVTSYKKPISVSEAGEMAKKIFK